MHKEIKLGLHPDWCAEGENVVGAKVIDPLNFRAAVYMAIADERWEKAAHLLFDCNQYQIKLPESSLHTVSCGWGERSERVGDYHLRFEQGRVRKFLHREQALPAHCCTVTVAAPFLVGDQENLILLVSLDVGAEGLPSPLDTQAFLGQMGDGNSPLCWGRK